VQFVENKMYVMSGQPCEYTNGAKSCDLLIYKVNELEDDTVL